MDFLPTRPPRHRIGLVFILVLSMSSKPAFACGSCGTAAIDYYLPFVLHWAILGALWMLLTSGLSWWRQGKITGHPGLIGAMAIIFVVGLLAIGWVGFGLGLLLFLPPAYALALSLFGDDSNIPNPTLRRDLRILGGFAIVAIGILAGFSQHRKLNRSSGEFILQWQSSAMSKAVLERLKHAPNGLGDLRYLLTHGDEQIAANAASQLGEIGEVSDLIRLNETLEKACLEDWYPHHFELLESAFERLKERKTRDPTIQPTQEIYRCRSNPE